MFLIHKPAVGPVGGRSNLLEIEREGEIRNQSAGLGKRKGFATPNPHISHPGFSGLHPLIHSS